MQPPVYLAKVIDLSGNVIANPLPAAMVTFTRRLALPGDQQLGNWAIDLIPARGGFYHHDAVYKLLDYRQRVEIYENEISGDPVFAGFIEDLPSDLGSESIRGPEWLAAPGGRRLHYYQNINGQIDDNITWLLKTWEPQFKDNFNRTAIGTDWAIQSGSWGISSNRLATTNTGTNEIRRTLGFSDTEFIAEISLKTGASTATWRRQAIIFQGGSNPWTLTIEHVAATDEFTRFTLAQAASGTTIQRDASNWELPFAEFCQVELWAKLDSVGTTQTVEVWLNGRQFLVSSSTTLGSGGTLAITANETGAQFENAILWTRESGMTAGTIESTVSTDNTDFPQDTHLQAISHYADLLDWEWRTTAKAGKGNDLFNAGATVGSDVSSTIRLIEGVNLVNLSLSPSGRNLATILHFWGQGQDDNQRLASAYDFDAWDTYGIIEDGISDWRISSNELARQKAENELVKRKDGLASMSATVIDGPATLNQWREGDTVWVETKRPDLNRTARIVEATYISGSLERQVVFDEFPRSRSGNIGRLMDDVGQVNRGTKGNAGQVILHYKSQSRMVDDFDRRIRYVGSTWQSLTGGASQGAYGSTLHFCNSNSDYLEFDFEGSGIAVLCRTGPNLVGIAAGERMQVTIDGTPYAYPSLYSSSNIDQVEVFNTAALTSGPHTIRLQRVGGGGPLVFIDLDAFRLYGWFWQFYLEGRAVNSALLSWEVSNASLPIIVKIDGTDRTAALGGGSGFTGNQRNLDVHQFISAPGLHTVEFINTNTSTETFLEASLACKVLI